MSVDKSNGIKIIDGDKYQYAVDGNNKRDADRIAKKWRDIGYSVRVFKKQDKYRTWYEIYRKLAGPRSRWAVAMSKK